MSEESQQLLWTLAEALLTVFSLPFPPLILIKHSLYSIMGWERKMERARRLHRPSLKNWEIDGLYEAFPDFQQSILERPPYEHFLITEGLSTNVPVILDGRAVSAETFARDYEGQNLPCVMTGIPERDDWKAIEDWKFDALEDNEDLRNRYFKCGEDDDGRSVKV